MPFSPLHLILALLLVGMLVAFVQIGILTIAFEKLGLSASTALTLLICSLLGSAINLPLFTTRAERPDINDVPAMFRGILRQAMREFTGKTVVAINVGGAIVPVLFSIYLLRHHPLPWSEVVLAIVLVAIICRVTSRPIPGLGIGMPVFVAPLSAALVAILTNPEYSAPLAYICGTLGVLIGADVLRIHEIRKMGAPVASIGGAGTFDGIFITGIVAVLLA
jgi:uncharacterized membrane protein